MLKKILLLVLFLVSVLSFTQAFAQDFDMEAALKMGEAGPQHKLLNDMTGNYKQKYKLDFPPGTIMESEGTSKIHSILGGRFITIDVIATMMDISASSLTIMGYDKRKNKYTLFSIDESGTYSVSAEGDYDSKTNVMTLSGSDYDPIAKLMRNYKFIFNFANENTHIMDIVLHSPTAANIKW